MDCISDILIIKNVCNELTATIRLVTCRETTANHENITLIDILLHLSDRSEDILLSKVAEYAHANLSTGCSPCLCRIIVAVCTWEYREICDWGLNRLALVLEISLLCLERLNLLKTCRNDILAICLSCIRIYLSELSRVGCHKVEDIELHAIDSELALLSISNLTYENCIRIVEFLLCLNED